MNTTIALNVWSLAAAASLVLALGILSWMMRLNLSAKLMIAALRTTVQLLLLGIVLKYVFTYVHLGWIVLMGIAMLLIAGREVMARQQRAFRGWWGYGLGTLSMFVSAFTITVFTLHIIIQPDPWYLPRYAIPLLGMMLGNTMTGVALTLDRLTTTAWDKRLEIEARLILGEDRRHAMTGILRDSVRTGLIPIINAMAAAGVISIPGMMTGQVLAGNPPFEAAKYQILIMFLIASGTGFATLLASRIAVRRLFDDRHRLRLERLREPV